MTQITGRERNTDHKDTGSLAFPLPANPYPIQFSPTSFQIHPHLERCTQRKKKKTWGKPTHQPLTLSDQKKKRLHWLQIRRGWRELREGNTHAHTRAQAQHNGRAERITDQPRDETDTQALTLGIGLLRLHKVDELVGDVVELLHAPRVEPGAGVVGQPGAVEARVPDGLGGHALVELPLDALAHQLQLLVPGRDDAAAAAEQP